MTPNPNEPVLDVGLDEYSLNGNVIGKTATDVSANQELLIVPLDDGLKKIRVFEQEEALKNNQPVDECIKAKLHVDENLSFGDFYKTFATMHFAGYSNIKYAIGTNFKEIYDLKLPTRSRPCLHVNPFYISPPLRYKYMRNRQKLSLDEILARLKIKDAYKLVCFVDYFKDYNSLDLMLSFYRENDNIVYAISLNEGALKANPSFDGFSFYSFNNLADLWKFIADIRSKEKLQNDSNDVKSFVAKCTSDLFGKHASLIFENDELMKDIAPLLKGLKAYGYNGDRIAFSVALW
ncbi:hypothetical protein [Fibrobacter sp. UWB12]|uniref:hypothetical protein n=1 Tax=Fibrobacter sp. UWB12 TaxID=1896203 RepID=UPI001114F784|nr:hypothetical protein [Fibrobacter sp. UWB12]